MRAPGSGGTRTGCQKVNTDRPQRAVELDLLPESNSGEVSNTTGRVRIMVDRAPSLIQSLLERRVQGHGMGLKEMAIFAGVLTSLIHAEVTGLMHNIWVASGLSMDGPVEPEEASQAVKSYMMFYILEEQMTHAYHSQLRMVERTVKEIYPAWGDTAMWVDDFRYSEMYFQKSRGNPFRKEASTYESTVALTQEVTHQFSSYQRLECANLKNQMGEMEHQGTGRVLLSRFYSGALGGDWTFGESPEYLRHLGVLDETNPETPTVVIPNYISSKTNCLVGSGFYSLCCPDECEALLRHVEVKVAAPSAAADQIAGIVAYLPSNTVDAPRNLSSALLDRLQEIADVHGGNVPLHGRLFAQWMHHVYPRECSLPVVGHRAEKTLAAKDWLRKHGSNSLEATTAEMQSHVNKLQEQTVEDVYMPWSAVEELVAENYVAPTKSAPWAAVSMRTCAAFMLLVSFAGTLARSGVFCLGSSKADSMMV